MIVGDDADSQTYIIVKPPPTASKNPLNLQVQLVVQTRRGRDRAPSSAALSARSASMGSVLGSNTSSPAKPTINLPNDPDSSSNSGNELAPVRSDSPTQISGDEAARSTTPLGAELKRSTSLKSSVSAISNGSAARTGTSTTGSGKRIEPMFNLAVHNVMQPTVVTDAATDTKVAKVSPVCVGIKSIPLTSTVSQTPSRHFWCRCTRTIRSLATYPRISASQPDIIRLRRWSLTRWSTIAPIVDGLFQHTPHTHHVAYQRVHALKSQQARQYRH